MQIYLDYSATTPCRPEAIAAMQEVLTQGWGNPSSLHEWGSRSAYRVEQARWEVAQLINAPTESIVFTSGGTESNNLALQGVARTFTAPQHLIISAVEHSAITKTAAMLERQGWQVTQLPVDGAGRIDPKTLEAALQSNTALVSIIYGQSEVGTLQPIEALGHLAQQAGALFHTDAVQAVGRVPIDVGRLPIDLLSMSAHKLYGPQGVGALYVKPGLALRPLMGGGGQEQGLRSGTQPVAMIAGFGAAAVCALAEIDHEPPRLVKLRDRLLDQLQSCPTLKLTGDPHHRLPHHASFCLQLSNISSNAPPISGRTLVKQMNLAGIGISAGSACNSGKIQPSPTLTAMGYTPHLAQAGIRITVGQQTTEADIDWTVTALQQAIALLTDAQ
ncbi:MAG: cysteine desulfurase [Thermosynechococcaceae cyanobacterium MS004]|nr:cysteine desulfurase [Thermosynechococcaceae cyanobacterium MS004]